MEQKKLNKRKCKNCGEVFQKTSSLQMVCSTQCGYDYKKKKAEGKPKKKKFIAPISEKRAGEMAEYRARRKVFLSMPENHYCPVMKHNTGAHVRVTEIHHTNGRENQRLNDEEYWLAVSRQGHQWIHANPKKARLLGWLI